MEPLPSRPHKFLLRRIRSTTLSQENGASQRSLEDVALQRFLLRHIGAIFKNKIVKLFRKSVDFALPCEISLFRDQTIHIIKANWVRAENHEVESAYQCWRGLDLFPRPPCLNIGRRIPLNVFLLVL